MPPKSATSEDSNPDLRTPGAAFPFVIVRRVKSLPGYSNVQVEIGDTPTDGENIEDLGDRIGREVEKRLRAEVRRATGPAPEGQKQATLGNA
jgi:hypothetical protein